MRNAIPGASFTRCSAIGWRGWRKQKEKWPMPTAQRGQTTRAKVILLARGRWSPYWSLVSRLRRCLKERLKGSLVGSFERENVESNVARYSPFSRLSAKIDLSSKKSFERREEKFVIYQLFLELSTNSRKILHNCKINEKYSSKQSFSFETLFE